MPIEQILSGLASQGQRAEGLARDVARELVRTQNYAERGNLGKLAVGLDTATKLVKELGQVVSSMQESYHLDPATYLRSEAYVSELRAAAESAGLAIFEEDGRLLCPPSVIRVLPRHAALEIDGKRDHRLRPSAVVATLADRQRQKPKFHYAAFFNSILEAYDLLIARNQCRPESVVRLVDIWRLLTLFPGREKEYTKQEFTRDLYLLDNSGITKTLNSDRRLRWCASSGTRSHGLLSTIGPDGRQKQYWGVSFARPA